jgi:DNA-binding FadR family transcriptional regulator
VEGTGKQEGSQIREAYRCFFAELGRAGRNALLRRLAGSVLAAALRAFPGEILYAVAAGGRGGELGLRAIYSAVERSDGEAARRSTGQHLLALERRLRDSGPPD